MILPHRADPQLSIRDLRERNRHVSFGLTVKQSFGGAAAAAAAAAE